MRRLVIASHERMAEGVRSDSLELRSRRLLEENAVLFSDLHRHPRDE